MQDTAFSVLAMLARGNVLESTSQWNSCGSS